MGKYCRQHIGKTFNDGKLTVLCGSDRMGFVKVKCSVCAEDPELFGDAEFETDYKGLVRGQLPCGCSRKPIWSLGQYEVRINRMIDENKLQIKFLGFGTPKKPLSSTSVKLLCTTSGIEYDVSSINGFMSSSRGFGGRVDSITHEIDLYNEQHPNHLVWDTGTTSCGTTVLGFHCKVCESNNYESLFTINSSNLFKGRIPCYCSIRPQNQTHDFAIERANKLLQSEDLKGVSVLGVVRGSKTWCPVFYCETHGVYRREYAQALATGCSCLKCNPPNWGYKTLHKGYIYVLEIKTTTEKILGYGITNNLVQRIARHKTVLSYIGATITNIQVFEGSGTAVLAVENAIKALHPTGLLDCEGFRRESISIDMKDKVLEKCSKLKELDNVDKLI